MSTQDLINAIFAGDTLAIEQHFQEGMDVKIGEKLETFKQEVATSMFKEEVEIEGLDAIVEAYEELDELSRGTLSNYVKKASTDGMNKAVDAADPHGKTQVQRGQAYGKATKRLKGIYKAASKLAKEDFEQLAAYIAEEDQIINDLLALDEISKATLGSYVKKASSELYATKQNANYNHSQANNSLTKNGEKEFRKNADSLDKKYKNRIKGIAKATDKLTKEQKEQIEAVLDEINEEFLDEALTHHDVLTKHGYKERLTGQYTHPEIRDVEVKVEDGKAISNDKTGDGKKSHSSPSKLNKYLNSLHDHDVKLK